MFLFVGLGNKGTEYENNRHNIGFLALDKIAETLGIEKRESLKFSSSLFQFNMGDKKILCIKPQTYMNLSGKAVLEAATFYKIPLSNIFVFHDDIDLELGKIKFKIGGGSGGHNGLKSIDEKMGKDYIRIRIGVGRPIFKNDVSNFVLSDFKKGELDEIITKIEKISKNLIFLLEKQFSILSQSII
jgi:PTH1 family peptidyl-tRNA hydrolase